MCGVGEGEQGEERMEFCIEIRLWPGQKNQYVLGEKRHLICHSSKFPWVASGCLDWPPGASQFQKRNCSQSGYQFLLYPI